MSLKHLVHPYQLLSSSSDAEGSAEPKQFISLRQKCHWGWVLFLLFFGISLAANLFALTFWLRCHKHGCSLYPQLTDTPAGSVLYYKPTVFAPDMSIYEQDPSPAVDTAWRELYEFSNSTLPGQEKVPSFNETLGFVEKGGNQIRMLDVFHQLHCLDTVRQALYPHHYHHPIDRSHVIHCVDSVRQSLMCMADVSLVSWEWNQELDILVESAGNIHTCRDFDRIREWAMENHLDRQFAAVTLQ